MATGNEQRIWTYHDGVSLLRVELFYDDEAGNWSAPHDFGTDAGAISLDVSVATPAA